MSAAEARGSPRFKSTAFAISLEGATPSLRPIEGSWRTWGQCGLPVHHFHHPGPTTVR